MVCRWSVRALLCSSWFSLLACESPISDLREWKPSDHDHTSQPSSDQVDVSEQNPLASHGVSEVALLAWRQNCVRCHGIIGRGDGPQAAMFHPPDLTDPTRQQQLTDSDISNVIRQGRGKMPGFQLPEPTLEGLVTLVRLLDSSGKRLRGPAGSAASSASAPPATGSAPAPTSGSSAPAPTQANAPTRRAPVTTPTPARPASPSAPRVPPASSANAP